MKFINKDEFNPTGNEFNKAISEKNPGLDAVEYYTPKEYQSGIAESLLYKEVSSDENSTTNNSDTTSDLEEYQENMENFNRLTNTADGSQTADASSSLGNEAEAVAEVEAGAAATGASASASVTSTVASLAGPISVVAFAAAAVATVASGIMEKKPNLISLNYESGTNYIKYEIEIDELSENMDYFIRVSNPTFSVEYPIEESGIQRQIVPDLKPYRTYDIEIVGKDTKESQLEYVYYSTTVSTDTLPKPVAVFSFIPNFNHILGNYDLDYETYISDYYKNSDNVYLQIYSGSKLLLEDHELPLDKFFRGTIKNITNSSAISAIVYGDYTDGRDWYYNTEISTFGYSVEVPEGFEFKNNFSSLYTFDNSCFYNSFDYINGNTLNINTGFEMADENEFYRIDLLNNGEIIDSKESTEKEISFTVEPYIKKLDIQFTPLKNVDDEIIEFEASLIKAVDIDPKIFSIKDFRMYEGGYYIELKCDKLSGLEHEFDITITENYPDGTSKNEEGQFTDSFELEGGSDASASSYDILVKYGDLTIEKLHISNEAELKLSNDNVIDEDGKIHVPFNINLPNNSKFESFTYYINGEELTVTEKDGEIEFSEINSELMPISGYINYSYEGLNIERFISIESIDFRNKYVAAYSVNMDSFSSSFDYTNGTTLNINTNFNTIDKNELYRIDLISNGEIIDSKESNESEISFNVAPYIKNIDVQFTPIKYVDEELVEFEASLIKEVDIDPKIFSIKDFRMYEGGYYIELKCDKLSGLEHEFDITITENYPDGTSKNEEGQFTDSFELEGGSDASASSYDILVKYGDLTIEKLHISNEAELKLSNDNVIDEDGKIHVPFNINLPNNSKFESFTYYINGEELTVTEKDGEIEFSEINSELMPISGYINYSYEGLNIERFISIESIDFRNKYVAAYSVNMDSFSSSFDYTNGTTLNINTNFNTIDKNELYRIDLISNGEIIDSKESNESEISFNVAPYIKNIDVQFTPIKYVDEELVEFESTLINEVDIDPKLFDMSFRAIGKDYYFGIQSNNAGALEKEYDLIITLNNEDGTNQIDERQFTEEFGMEGGADFKPVSYDILVKYGELVLENIHIDNDNYIELDSNFDIDDDGAIHIPYEIKLPDGATFESFSINLNEEDITFENETGEIVLNKVDSNLLSIEGVINYTYNGVTIEKLVSISNYDLGANLVVSHYAPYMGSFYDNYNFQFEAYVKDKLINLEFNPKFYGDDETEMASELEKGYFSVSSSYSKIKYDLADDGFPSDTVDLSGFINGIGSTDSMDYLSSIYDFNINYPVTYFKTLNDDGTVNYYFNTGFKDTVTDSNYSHKYRIVYTYHGTDGLIYKYGEYTTSETYKLENIEDLDYDFGFYVYFDDISNGLTYETKISGYANSKIICSKVDVNSVFLNNPTMYNLTRDENNYTIIDSTFDLAMLDPNENIEFTYKDKTILVPLKSKTDDGVIADGDTYKYEYYTDDQSLGYIVNVDDLSNQGKSSIVYVEAIFKEKLEDFTYKAAINVHSLLDGAINEFIESGSYDVTNKDSASGIATKNINYVSTYNLDNMTASFGYDSTNDTNTLSIGEIEFTQNDSKEQIYVEVYSNGALLAQGEYDSYWGSSFRVDPAYTNIQVKIYEYIKENISPIGPFDYTDVFECKGNLIDEREFSTPPQEIVTNVNLTETSDLNEISVEADDFSDYKLKVTKYYYLIENGVKSKTLLTEEKEGDVGETTVGFTHEDSHSISKYVVEIYKNTKVYSIFELNVAPEIGDYEYNDGEDYITLPYDLKLPTDAVLKSSTASVGGVEVELSQSGTFTINNLETNVVLINFSINYELNGASVHYEFETRKTLEGELDVDYEIASYPGNSSYGNFSCNYNIYYNPNDNKIYTYDSTNDTYYDEDGIEIDDPSVLISSRLENDIYALKVKSMTMDIGCFKNVICDDYVLNVAKAGGNVIDTTSGSTWTSSHNVEANVLKSYTEASSEIAGIYITFLHENIGIEYYDYAVHGINNCSLEFSVLIGGNVYYTKSIEFKTPRHSDLTDISAFSIDRANINNTITKNADDTINMTIQTGFDSESYPNNAYKIVLYDKTDYNGYEDGNLAYESDYLTSNVATLSNLANTNYEVYIEIYNIIDGEYVKQSIDNVGRANSPIVSTDWRRVDEGTTTYHNYVYLDTNYINPDYLAGTKKLSFKTGEIDLSSLGESQSVSGCTVEVTDQGNGVYIIDIYSTNSSNPHGSLVIEQGNSETGYNEVAYTI